MLSFIYCYAECSYGECRYAECHFYAECHYAECRYAECRYTECHFYAECRYAECQCVIANESDRFLSFFVLALLPWTLWQ